MDLGLDISPGDLGIVHVCLPKWRKYKFCSGNFRDQGVKENRSLQDVGKSRRKSIAKENRKW